MLRGFARFPQIATMEEVYGVKPVAIAVYPMYRGLAKLVGMTVVEPGKTLADQMEVLKANWDTFDFFFLHYKYTDSTGEDGNFAKKVEMIEALDAEIPKALALDPDVLIVTGDHSTPSRMMSHSFHPVPLLLWAPATVAARPRHHLRRAPLPARRPRPGPRQGHHAPGPGPRRPAPEVRRLSGPRWHGRGGLRGGELPCPDEAL